MQGWISAILQQPDGEILVAGVLDEVFDSDQVNGVARLHPDGRVDSNFISGIGIGIEALALQKDGKILVGGDFGAVISSTGNSIYTQFKYFVRLQSQQWVTPPLRNTELPRIQGVLESGQIIKATPGKWSAKPDKITYTWKIGEKVLSNKRTLRLTPSAKGKPITLLVTATKTGYAPGTAKIMLGFGFI